ncbi:hypothetical protein [Cyclobacterium jeungdonense]|uniref:hypothetical protein n=1 Tax=Cyclobacterium jeungdonense TaxID=708087 RepID=UPI0013D44EBD|nr:hypothetical protein [Cyclobacterium jeungdonense]
MDCEPKDVSALKWGPWKALESEADKAAQIKARESAAGACHGKCKDTSCIYIEISSELLDTEERDNDSNQKEFRSKVISKGTCECK